MWGATSLLSVALVAALATREAGPVLLAVTAAVASLVLVVGWVTRADHRRVFFAVGPMAVMAYLLAYGSLAPQAATLTISLWPMVFAYVGVTAAARTGAWLLPVPAVGIWLAMDLPIGLAVPRWLIVMGLVVVVTQLPARLLTSIRDGQLQLENEHQEVLAAQRALGVSMERFAQAFAASPVGMSLLDESGRLVEVNPALCELVGKTPAELIGRSAAEMTGSADRESHHETQALLEESAELTTAVQTLFVRPDGEERCVELRLAPVSGPDGGTWMLVHVTDVTDRRLAEEAEARGRRISRVLADVTRSVVSRRDEVRDAVAQGAQQLSGATGVALVEELDGQTLVVTAATDVRNLGLRVDLGQLTMTGTVWRTGVVRDVVDVASEATVNPALAEVHSMVSGYWQPVLGPSGDVLAVLTMSWDDARTATSSELRHAMDVLAAEAGAALHDDGARRRLEASATLDPLTGLTNRRGWDLGLAQMVGPAPDGSVVAVAMIDLDRFKQFNDAHGHPRGDGLLIDFADVLRTSVRSGDLLSRWGGDEFAMAITVQSIEQARAVVDRVVGAVPEGQTCSIGLALHTPGTEFAATLARADRALYSAKAGGRNGVAHAD